MEKAEIYWKKQSELNKFESNPSWIEEALMKTIEISYVEGQIKYCAPANEAAKLKEKLKILLYA